MRESKSMRKKNKLMVSGASYSAANWNEPHWADIIAEQGDFKKVEFEGINWSDWEAGAFVTIGRLLNDRKISHLIYTGTFTFVEQLQQENIPDKKSLFDLNEKIVIDMARTPAFLSKLGILFSNFMPTKSRDPAGRRLGNREWVAHRGVVASEAPVVPANKVVDKFGQVFVGLEDTEFYTTPQYKRYLRALSSISLVKAICDQLGVKVILLPFPFTDDLTSSTLTRLPDFSLMDIWDIIPESFGSIENWRKLSSERGWIPLASHFDDWGHDQVAKAFLNNDNNKEFLK